MKNNKLPATAPQETPVDWHAMLPGEVVNHLQTDLEKGLSKSEAAARLDRYGLNQLQEKPPPTFLELVFRQLNNFVIILLIVAAVIMSGMTGAVTGAHLNFEIRKYLSPLNPLRMMKQ